MSDFQLTAQHSDSNHDLRVIRSPLLASGCVAICVFSSIVAFFFGNLGACYACGSRLIKVLNTELALSIDNPRQIWRFIDDGIFLNLFLLSIAAFAGYLFTGALKRWVGLVPLLFAGLFGALFMITRLQHIIGVAFLPEFVYSGLWGGGPTVQESLFFIWLALSVLVIPIIYLIGSIRQKTIPIWKSFVLVLAPAITIVFGLVPAFVLRGNFFEQGFFYWFSWGMSFWILFAVVIFSELRRTKAKQSYIRLTLILSLGAVVLSIIVISVFSFGVYQRAMELKKQRTLLMPPPTLFASPDPKVISTKISESVLDSQNVDQFLHRRRALL